MKGYTGLVSAAGSAASGLPGKLGKLGGTVGLLASSLEAGIAVGQLLNSIFDKLGYTGEETIGKLVDGAGTFTKGVSKVLSFIDKITFGVAGLGGGFSDVDTKKGTETANNKLVETIMKKKGLSEMDAKKAVLRAEKENTPIHKILEGIEGKKKRTAEVQPQDMKKMQKDQTSALASVMKKPVINTVPEKTNILTNAKMATPTRQENKQQSTTTDEATLPQTTASNETTDQFMASGSFVGGINGDGSITLKVDNFMNVFAGAMGQMKSKTMRPSSVA
jgi:hypothetical protein